MEVIGKNSGIQKNGSEFLLVFEEDLNQALQKARLQTI
jgi:hypothetical protein